MPRTVEFLEALADRHVGRERQLARLEAAEREDFGMFTAENDPRFMWALEAECWARLLLLPRVSGATPEERMEPVAAELLKFEQKVQWAKLDELRKRPASDTEREACLLALALSTGWSGERILGFDFSSLPRPESGGKAAPMPAGDPGREVVKTAAEVLLLASQVPAPSDKAVENKLSELRRARIALAERYLAPAEASLRSGADGSALTAWRIARARCDLEKSSFGL